MSFSGLKIYNDVTSQILVRSDVDATGFILPKLIKGDIIPLSYILLEESTDIAPVKPFNIIAAENYSLKIGLFKKEDKSCLAFSSDFINNSTDGISKKIGTLNLNTQEISEYLTSKSSATVAIEIEVRDLGNNPLTTYQADVVLLNDYIQEVGYSVIPEETIATTDWATSQFIQKIGTTHEQYILISPSGYQFLVWINDDGELKISRLQ